jgi:hypothetical protein
MSSYVRYSLVASVVVAATLLLGGCMRVEATRNSSSREFYGYLNSFLREYQLRGGLMQSLPSDLSMEFVGDIEMEERAVAYCELSVANKFIPRIAFLRSYWNSSSKTIKELLMFHELGHCFLNYDHVTSNSNDIMFPTLIDPTYYRENRDAVLDKFFDPSDRPMWSVGVLVNSP